LLAKGDELNLNLPKFARPLYFVIRLFGTSIKDREEIKEMVNIFVFKFAALSTQNETGLDARLDGKI